MARRVVALKLATVLVLLIVLPAILPSGAAETPPDGGAKEATGKTIRLKGELEKGLRARRRAEFAFIAKVVRLVEQGILPRRLVDSTFLWARAKNRHPFQYFRYALTIRARRRGVRL